MCAGGLGFRAQKNLHALGGGADSGIIAACVADNFVDDLVGMLGIVVIENQFLRAALHGDVDGFAPMAVSPAPTTRRVFFGQILRVINKKVGAFGQVAYGFVELNVSRFVVGGIDKDAIFRFHAEPEASLRMIEVGSLDLDTVLHVEVAVFDIVEAAAGFHVIKVHREIRRSHLLRHDLFEAPCAGGGMEIKAAIGIVVQRTKKGHALDVVPVKVRNENVSRESALAELALERVAEHAKSGAAIEDEYTVADPHFDARRVAAVPHVLELWRGRRTAYAPELDAHKTW